MGLLRADQQKIVVPWPIALSWFVLVGLRKVVVSQGYKPLSVHLMRKINMVTFLETPHWIPPARGKKKHRPSTHPPDYSSPCIDLLRSGTSVIGNVEAQTVIFGWLLNTYWGSKWLLRYAAFRRLELGYTSSRKLREHCSTGRPEWDVLPKITWFRNNDKE